MNKKPFISVIIPTYNRRELLGQAIESVINQTFSDWEALVIDDGSEIRVKDLVEGYGDSRIQYHYKRNGGLASARNYGIERAEGEYLCYLDDDDLYAPSFFESIAKHAQEDKILVFAYDMKDMQGNLIRTVKPDASENFVVKYIEETYSPIPFVYPRSIACSRSFDEDDLVYEDVPYILPLIAQNKLKCINISSCTVRQHKERITGTKYSKHKEQMYEQVRDNICRVIESQNNYLPYTDVQLKSVIHSKFHELLKGTVQVDWNYLPDLLRRIKEDYPDYEPPSNYDLRIKWIKAGVKKLIGK